MTTPLIPINSSDKKTSSRSTFLLLLLRLEITREETIKGIIEVQLVQEIIDLVQRGNMKMRKTLNRRKELDNLGSERKNEVHLGAMNLV